MSKDIIEKLDNLESELSDEEIEEIEEMSLNDMMENHAQEIEKWHRRSDETFMQYEMFRAFLKPKAPSDSRTMLQIINDHLEAHDYKCVTAAELMETKDKFFWESRRAAYNELIDEKRREYDQLIRSHTNETLMHYSDALLKTAISKALAGDTRILQYLLDRVMPEKDNAADIGTTVIRLEIPGLETSSVQKEDQNTIDMLRKQFDIEKEDV